MAFLVSEAVRGEGGLLRNGKGERFMPDYHADAELAPRDVVARAVKAEREATGEVTLDVSPLTSPKSSRPRGPLRRARRRLDAGIPVAPAEHFLCGGIDVDDRGRTTLDRLYAVGECSRTGVHGANRLASTSLLEGLVWGLRAGGDAAGADPEPIEAPELLERDPDLPERFARDKFQRLTRVMAENVGVERDPADLQRAMAVLRRLKGEVDAYVRTRPVARCTNSATRASPPCRSRATPPTTRRASARTISWTRARSRRSPRPTMRTDSDVERWLREDVGHHDVTNDDPGRPRAVW